MSKIKYRFNVRLLPEAISFLEQLSDKTRDKVLYNIWKSRALLDPELFKKVSNEIWEFRTLYADQSIRMLSFWDKANKLVALVIVTHGFVKKTVKLPILELNHAMNLRLKYVQNENQKPRRINR
jgi:phage-related protein